MARLGTASYAQLPLDLEPADHWASGSTPAAPTTGNASRRLLGAFYTPQTAADYMADWTVRRDGEHLLEPSFGDGIFLRAVRTSACHKGFAAVRLSGIEIDRVALAQAIQGGTIAAPDAHHNDFLRVRPFTVQAVIGNPPYVRLRHIPAEQRASALKAAELTMGTPMDPSGSLWMPFMLHALRFLDAGGRLALVLPYDFTYVRYARPLWEKLRRSFSSLQVLRTHERLFPDLLQDVIILLADGYGSSTDSVRYQAFERTEDLLTAHPVVDELLSVEDVAQGERAFLMALLGQELRHLLSGRVAAMTAPARDFVTFNIGYVAGDKTFFHPTDDFVSEYRIPARSLRSALTATRALKGSGLGTSSLTGGQQSRLFFPDSKNLTAGERRYIAMGENHKVSARYKCRIRNPWYVVPGVRVPDVVLSVFSECPLLMINDADCVASNSLLCGYRRGVTNQTVATSWYTSLTLLQCELEVHALGGGVMVMVPREAGNVRLPTTVQVRDDHLRNLDRLLRRKQLSGAYLAGDREVLVGQLGFSEHDVELIRHGIEVLTHWRTSARSSRQAKR